MLWYDLLPAIIGSSTVLSSWAWDKLISNCKCDQLANNTTAGQYKTLYPLDGIWKKLTTQSTIAYATND